MDYSKLTKEEIIEGIKVEFIYLKNLSDDLKNDKEIVLEAIKKENVSSLYENNKKWYKERMKVLANIREKELIENSIETSKLQSKKLKF